MSALVFWVRCLVDGLVGTGRDLSEALCLSKVATYPCSFSYQPGKATVIPAHAGIQSGCVRICAVFHAFSPAGIRRKRKTKAKPLDSGMRRNDGRNTRAVGTTPPRGCPAPRGCPVSGCARPVPGLCACPGDRRVVPRVFGAAHCFVNSQEILSGNLEFVSPGRPLFKPYPCLPACLPSSRPLFRVRP